MQTSHQDLEYVFFMVVYYQCTLCGQVFLMVVYYQSTLCGQVFLMVVYYQCTLCGQVSVSVFTIINGFVCSRVLGII